MHIVTNIIHVHVVFVPYASMQVVPLDLKSDEQELKAFNVRMDDLYAIDLTFLQGFDQPTLAYLAEVRLCTQDNSNRVSTFF